MLFRFLLCFCFVSHVVQPGEINIGNIKRLFEDIIRTAQKTLGHIFLDKIGLSRPKYNRCYGCLDGEEFDFIVVGAGAAGSVVANRLSEDPKSRVLLIEAGDVPPALSNIPSLGPIWGDEKDYWRYKDSTEENSGLGSSGGHFEWFTGKGLGGNSLVDYMIADRGSPGDYDKIAALGNPGWSYKEVLPYFKKIETATVIGKNELRGNDGPLHVSSPKKPSKITKVFIDAALEGGYKYGNRNNGNGTVGYTERLITNNGLRETAEKAYLRPAINRKNLVLLTSTRVYRVNFKGLKARSVEVINNSTKQNCTIKATKEIILCAGTFGTPQILMYSGIGPKNMLSNYGIKTIQNLQVGQNLVEHLALPSLLYKANDSSFTINLDKLLDSKSLLDLVKDKNGPLTQTGIEATAYYKTKNVQIPDISLLLVPTSYLKDKNVFKRIVHISDLMYDSLYGQYKNCPNIFFIVPVLLLPESRGSIAIQSKNPLDSLKIQGNILKSKFDIVTAIKGIREVERIGNSEVFKHHGIEKIDMKLDKCSHFAYNSDQYWQCVLKYISVLMNDAMGTCKMGPKSDKTTVVDHKLRIRGIQGLRVVDKSILPCPISAIGRLPSYMIGEKGAHLIKQDWRKSKAA